MRDLTFIGKDQVVQAFCEVGSFNLPLNPSREVALGFKLSVKVTSVDGVDGFRSDGLREDRQGDFKV